MRAPLKLRSNADALILILGLSGMALVAFLLLVPTSAQGAANLPVSLHSQLQANYGVDPRGRLLAPVGMRLVEQAIENLGDAGRLTQIASQLLTPVPTVTPFTLTNPTLTPANSIIWTATRTAFSPNPANTTPMPTQRDNTTPTATRPAPTQTLSSTPTARTSPQPTASLIASSPTLLPSVSTSSPKPTSMPTTPPPIQTQTSQPPSPTPTLPPASLTPSITPSSTATPYVPSSTPTRAPYPPPYP